MISALQSGHPATRVFSHFQQQHLDDKFEDLDERMQRNMYLVISGQYVPKEEDKGGPLQQMAAKRLCVRHLNSDVNLLRDTHQMQTLVQKLDLLDPSKAAPLAERVENVLTR